MISTIALFISVVSLALSLWNFGERERAAMPWVKIVKEKHSCRRPFNDEENEFAAGSIWQCPDCDQKWEFKPYWLDANRWVKL